MTAQTIIELAWPLATQVALAISEYAWLVWPAWLAYLVSSLVRGALRSRAAASFDRALAGSVEVKGMSRSLRQEGVPDADRHQLAIEIWRRNLDLGDPP